MVEWRRFEGGDKPDSTGVVLTPHIQRALMLNSEPREGHSERVPAVPPALEPVVSRRSLAVMLGGLSLLRPLSINAMPTCPHSSISSAIFTQRLADAIILVWGLDLPLGSDYRSRGMEPSVSACIKATSASSSASDRPRCPTLLVFMLSVDSGAGQHVAPSPASWGLHRGRTSRVL